VRKWLRSQGAKFGGLRSSIIVAEGGAWTADKGRAFDVAFAVIRALGGIYAETGRSIRGFLAGESVIVGSVVVEALYFSLPLARERLDAFEIESKILCNFRLVVLRATGIFGRERKHVQEKTRR